MTTTRRVTFCIFLGALWGFALSIAVAAFPTFFAWVAFTVVVGAIGIFGSCALDSLVRGLRRVARIGARGTQAPCLRRPQSVGRLADAYRGY